MNFYGATRTLDADYLLDTSNSGRLNSMYPSLMKSSKYVDRVFFQRPIMKLVQKEIEEKIHQSSLFHVHNVDNVDDTQKQVTGRLPWQQHWRPQHVTETGHD